MLVQMWLLVEKWHWGLSGYRLLLLISVFHGALVTAPFFPGLPLVQTPAKIYLEPDCLRLPISAPMGLEFGGCGWVQGRRGDDPFFGGYWG